MISKQIEPTPTQSCIHTIDIKVKDDQGDESGWGGITFVIDYNDYEDASEPYNPCNSQ